MKEKNGKDRKGKRIDKRKTERERKEECNMEGHKRYLASRWQIGIPLSSKQHFINNFKIKVIVKEIKLYRTQFAS